MKQFGYLSSLFISLAVLCTPIQAFAHSHEHGWGGHEHYHENWHRGEWHHEWHDGRFGWWWLVNGAWFWYAAATYPYPAEPYAPAVIQYPAPPSPQPPASFWYYCSYPAGYYPSIPNCPGGWQAVPAPR